MGRESHKHPACAVHGVVVLPFRASSVPQRSGARPACLPAGEGAEGGKRSWTCAGSLEPLPCKMCMSLLPVCVIHWSAVFDPETPPYFVHQFRIKLRVLSTFHDFNPFPRLTEPHYGVGVPLRLQ